jgi:NADH pyrophosphatase NudC (nudix superfamily)
MVLTSIFIVIAVGLLAFTIIARPFHEGVEDINTEQAVIDQELAALDVRCKTWLRDLELEFSSGKMDEVDYQQQKALLEKEIHHIEDRFARIRTEKLASSEKELETLISGRRMQRMERSAGFCVQCGAPLQQSDKFCSNCGMKLE